MKKRCSSKTARAVPFLMTALLLTTSAGAEEQVVDAFSVYEAKGDLSRTGPSSATFVGTMSGMFFIRTPEGPSYRAQLTCPGTLEVDLESGEQTGTGKCTIADPKGNSVFGDWTCAGFHLIGCIGDLTLTGGTGRFEGITGGGGMTVRGDVHEIVGASGDTLSQVSTGIVFWNEFRFLVP